MFADLADRMPTTWRAEEWTPDERAAWEEGRHRCEVIFWLRLRAQQGSDIVHRHLQSVLRKRGQQAYNRLLWDCQQQWTFGHRGQVGEWFGKGGERLRRAA